MSLGKYQNDFYHNPKWLSLKQSVLAENKYMCQVCKQKNKMIPAEQVHHIFPIENYPEYKLQRWNLIPLCLPCHNAMHNRFTGELSKNGELLQRQTAYNNGIVLNIKPQTILVIGLPGTGKTTYVQKHLDQNSLAYDLDAIAGAFRLRAPHAEIYKPARKMANDFLKGFINKAHDYAKIIYIIRTAPSIKELTMIDPTSLVVCSKVYKASDVVNIKETSERIGYVHDYCVKQGIDVEVLG